MKYDIIYNNKSSVKSPYALRIVLPTKPDNEEEIKKWLIDTFGKFGYIYKVIDSGFFYAEIYLKHEGDATAFELKWGGTLQEPTEE